MTTTVVKTMVAAALGLAIWTVGAPGADACTAPGTSGGAAPSVQAEGSPFTGGNNDAMASRSSKPSATVHTRITWKPVELKEMAALTGRVRDLDEADIEAAEERHLRRQIGHGLQNDRAYVLLRDEVLALPWEVGAVGARREAGLTQSVHVGRS